MKWGSRGQEDFISRITPNKLSSEKVFMGGRKSSNQKTPVGTFRGAFCLG